MRWLLRRIDDALRRLAEEGGEAAQPDAAAGAREDEVVAAARERARVHKIERHTIGPPADSDGVGWDQERIDYVEDERTQVVVEHRDIRQCSCGGMVGYKASLAGLCGVCGRTLCTRDGCVGGVCERCGTLVCQRHAVGHNGYVFCTRHRLFMYWVVFWQLLE